MSASSSLSIELWQTILRYAIGVPNFLDADAYQGILSRSVFTHPTSRMNDERAYWAAEKTRNRLRRVSISWDAYLQLFEHRFVRLLDIRHGILEPKVLQKAIRVSFGRYGCKCDQCSTYIYHLAAICLGVEDISMEIADMMEEEYLIINFLRNVPKLSRVRTLIGPKCAYASSFTQLVGKLSNLCHFHGKGFRGASEIGCNGKFASQSLVTLSFDLRLGGVYDTLTWDLPSLRYLRISGSKCASSPTFVATALLSVLGAVGRQLHSFYFLYQPTTKEMLAEIWNLCPSLQIFLSSVSLVSPPPYFHPIHTIGVTRGKQLEHFQPLPEWPNVRRIIISRPWGQDGDGEWTSALAKQRSNVRIENGDGLTREEYIQREMDKVTATEEKLEVRPNNDNTTLAGEGNA